MTAPHLPAGQVVAGKYTVRALLAYTDGMASYHATDAQGAQVVLKLLDPAIGQRADVMGELDRVAGETAALAQCSVLPVLDAGYDVATGAPFRAAEYLNIPSLARLVDNGPLSEEVVAAILRGAAIALDAAHGRQLYHFGLKPTNLFIGPAPHFPVLVADFGSRVIHEAQPSQETYVQSAPWLAPEQLYPGVALGARTDVYSLALLAFYALTGRPYWWTCQSSPLDVQAWQQEMLAAHVAVSRRAAELGRHIQAAHDELFARALATNPAERPASAGEFAMTLGQRSAGYASAAPLGGGPPPPQPFAPPGYPPAPDPGYPQPTAAAPPAAGPAPTVAMPVAMAPSGPGAEPWSMPPPGPSPGAAGPPPAAFGASEAAAAATGLPTFAEPSPRKKPAGTVPILIGIVAALLIGVVVVTVLFLRAREEPSETASADTDASTPEASTMTSEADPLASAQPGSGGGSASSKDAGSAEEQTVQVTFVCIPPCDKIVVDGEPLAEPTKPIALLPGKHTVEASKGGYATRKQSFEVELSEPIEKKFIMVPATAPAPSPQPKKKCGKFLKRCD